MITSKIDIKGELILLNAYSNALSPEQNFKTERASYKLKQGKNKLTITIKAKDPTAFRAVSNSISGLLSLVEKNWRKANER